MMPFYVKKSLHIVFENEKLRHFQGKHAIDRIITSSMVSKMMMKKEKQLFIDTQKAEEKAMRSKWRDDFRLTEQIWQLILISLHYLSNTTEESTHIYTLSHTQTYSDK